jgi:hypothetical protein
MRMSDAKQMLEWAKEGDVKGAVAKARQEATRRGHGQQTAFAGAGGLLGAILGSFRGAQGAAFGAFLGALVGALLGKRRDQSVALPTKSGRKIIHAQSRAVIRTPQPHRERDYVDVMYAD